MKRAKRPTTTQMSVNARRILERTAKAAGITDATYRDLPDASYRALARIGSGTVFAMPRSGMSLPDTEQVPLCADLHARLSAYAYSRGMTVDAVAEALISTALEREHARIVPVTSYLSSTSTSAAGHIVHRSKAPVCLKSPGRCAQPFHWRNTLRCGCDLASGRNAG